MKNVKTILILLPLLIVLTACGANNNTEKNYLNKEGLKPLTIAILPSLDAIPIIIAYEKGFFEAEGLHVNIEQFSSARDRDIAFQGSPHIDGLVFDLIGLSIYYEGGIPMVAVAASTGLASVIGNETVQSLEDIYGKQVLISRNTSMEYILYTALASVGLTLDDVIIEEVPALPTRLEMLLHGQAAAATLPEPFVTMGLNQGLNVLTSTRELGINPFIFAFRQEVIQTKPAEIEAFLRACNAAIHYLNTADREEYIDIIIDFVGYPTELRDVLIVPEFTHMHTPHMQDVEMAINWSKQMGLLTKDLNPNDVVVNMFGE